MADEIRTKEADAREIVARAKTEAARIAAAARTNAEQSVKEARQKSHRYFRDQVKIAESEAETAAVKSIETGRRETEEFYEGNKSRVSGVAEWLIKEVMSTYGNS
jgi:V/A-type H+-transporting ATPase subunit G/H